MELAPEIENKSRIANYRPAFVFAIGSMLGIAACAMLETKGVLLLAVLLSVCAGALFIIKSKRTALFVIAVLFGLASAFAARPMVFQEGTYIVSGIAVDSYQSADGNVIVLKRCTLNGKNYNKRIQLITDEDSEVRIGDEVQTLAECRELRKRSDSFSEYSSKLAAGIGCIASAETATAVSSHNAPVTEFLMKCRSGIRSRIDRAFGSDSGIFSALIIGVKTEVGEDRYSVFKASGTSHLLAISGLHMSVLTACISVLIPKRRKVMKLVLLGLFMLFYCTAAAYAPGLVRAAIMTFVMLLADCFERQRDSLSALSIAAILILAVNPYQLYSIGFRLSFSACFGLILLTRSISGAIRNAHITPKLADPAAVCIAATLGTFPLQMRYFNSFTPYALIANLVAVPLFSVVVVTGFIVTLIAFLSPNMAASAAYVPRGVLFCIEKYLSYLGKLPLADMQFKSPPMLCCVIWLMMLFAASQFTLRPRSKRLLYAACLLVLFTTVYFIGIIRA